MNTLAQQYASDPALLAFYQTKLLRRGWAGSVTPEEQAYQAENASWAGVRKGVAADMADQDLRE